MVYLLHHLIDDRAGAVLVDGQVGDGGDGHGDVLRVDGPSDDARLGVDGKPVEGRAGSGNDHDQRAAVGGFKSRGEGVRTFDDHQRGVRFKRGFDAGCAGANPAEGDGQILEPGGVRMEIGRASRRERV